MTNLFVKPGLAILLAVLMLAAFKHKAVESADITIGNFKNPPADARPFVRWWWNGDKVNKQEISRELDLLKKAGFGGVEINPILFPESGEETGAEALPWMSDEWIDVFVHACQKAKENGMIADAIVGSGWPFGGEFLQNEETCQRVITNAIPYKGVSTISLSEEELKEKILKTVKWWHMKEDIKHELLFIKLIPEKTDNYDSMIDLTGRVDRNGNLNYALPKQSDFVLSYGFVQKNYETVRFGAPGASGAVLDHYKKDVTLKYLSRLLQVSKKSGIPLSELLRALFCDSIELSGANWTDDFAILFKAKYGYDLSPWFPWVFSADNQQNGEPILAEKLQQEIKRVRYDYNELLVETFLSNFTQTFQEFCTSNNLQCRYQAYGTPFLMGMLNGYTMVDIPESNNWIYSAEMKGDSWSWNQDHGYMIWNMYAAAGGHLSGRKIISNEAMTNLNGVFRTTLEEIKQHDDMNFITGMNHSVVHGFNYSPPEAKFPGWIRFGTYFSEQNTWWPYINKWVDYNARLSYLFQNSQAKKSIAIIGPEADHWGERGLVREVFHMKPWYLYKIWEPISQLGYSCEYLNLDIVNKADVSKGSIQYGPMDYKLLVLAGLKSLHPETALKIEAFVKAGGQVLVLGAVPNQSLHFQQANENDQKVQKIFGQLQKQYQKNIIVLDEPQEHVNLLGWMKGTLAKTRLQPDVKFDNVYDHVYQINSYTKDKEIFFITNVHRNKSVQLKAAFPVKNKYPYVWNPETGERYALAGGADASPIDIYLGPIESIVIVFEEEKPSKTVLPKKTNFAAVATLSTPWTVIGHHANGQQFRWQMDKLVDFSKDGDTAKTSFAGTLVYSNTFTAKEGITHIDLGDTNEGITEVFINGKSAGIKWYGRPIFDITTLLKEGENAVEIHYTTVLANYCQSLKDNPTAQFWTKKYAAISTPTGMEGSVRLLQAN